jgi:PmbA protein
MEPLLEKAKGVSDQSEVYSREQGIDSVYFENGGLKNIDSQNRFGISLRIIKDGLLGFAYTRNLLDPGELLGQAQDSLRGEVEAQFEFPASPSRSDYKSYDPAIEDLSSARLVEEGRRIIDSISQDTRGQVNLTLQRTVLKINLLNSRGTELQWRTSSYGLHTALLYPGSYASVERSWMAAKFEPAPEEYLEYLWDLYNRSQREVRPPSGRMKCLFLPETVYSLIWRIQSAANARNVFEKVSPLGDRRDEKIFDDRISLYDNPLNYQRPNARGFDDEGISCHPYGIIDRGVLRNFYYDLNYAQKLKAAPSGHGYRVSPWGGEPISVRPSPALKYLYLDPGHKTFKELIQSMDKGMVIAGVLGAHSGNIANGDFSIGLAPGIYVEKGEVVGQVKDAMVAGNIYQALQNVVDLEHRVHPCPEGNYPALLLDDVSVAIG